MSFSGHAQDMMSKIKYNLELRENNRGNFTAFKRNYIKYKKSLLKVNKAQISTENLEKIKADIRKKIKRRNRILNLIYLIFIPILILIVVLGIKKFLEIEIHFTF